MLTLTDLRCEYLSTPLGVETPQPRLSWISHHPERNQCATAYQIQAAGSAARLTCGEPDVWDSGKVSTVGALPVEYGGRTLHSRERIYWRVRAWDSAGVPGPYSEPSWFEMGLLQPADWTAEWIGYPASWNGRALYFRKEFALEKPVQRVRIYISGLGYYELHANGEKVGDRVLDPGTTTYNQRVLYAVYDLEPYLRQGRNALGVIVGNGWYGAPKLIAQIVIDFQDGTTQTIRTGYNDTWGGWGVGTGPLLENSIYNGETYDARLEWPGWDTPHPTGRPASPWGGAVVTDPPGGHLVSEMMEPIRVVETLQPRTMNEPRPGVYVYDLGQNIAGWARLRVQGEPGMTVTLKFAESLYPNGTVNQENLRGAAATDHYTLRGEGVEEWEPRFTYHGFRYIQMEGFPGLPNLDAVEGRVVRSAVEPVGKFACSDDLLNRIYQMVWHTEASNLHSIPTDCPQRDERMGWLNDMAARTEEALYNFGLARLLSKWAADIADAQDPRTGAITDTAPYRWGNRPADPVCGCYLIIPWMLYLHYGDKRTMADHYAGFKAWVDYLGTRAEDHIVGYSHWGDWSPPAEEALAGSNGSSAVSAHTPGSLISTGFYYYGARLIAQMAEVLGEAGDAHSYTTLAAAIAGSYNRHFWNEDAGGYGSNNQACNAFSLYMGLTPADRRPRVVDNLVNDVLEIKSGHLSTGNICTKYLLEALTDAGRTDVAYTIAAQETYPGWGFMLANGATTLWERWEQLTGGGMNSHNHPMMGSVGSWFYKALGGITVDPAGPGFARFNLRPWVVGSLTHVTSSLQTVRGPIESAWTRETGQVGGVTLRVTIPVGSQARVSVPKPGAGSAYRVTEGQHTLWLDGKKGEDAPGIAYLQEEERFVTFECGSGTYEFACTPSPVA
jgi:alpha-L-rhamnosidase